MQPLSCFAGKQSVFPSLASVKAQLADLGAGDLQAELCVTRRVDERSEWQPSVEIESSEILDSVVLYLLTLFCY